MGDQPIIDSFFHQIVHSTARISIQQPNGNGSAGTGFFYTTKVPLSGGQTRENLLLISNKHVLEDGRDGLVTLRLNRGRLNKGAEPDYGNTHYYHIENLAERYIPHPDPAVDLACVPIEDIPSFTYMRTVTSILLPDTETMTIRPGSDVWFVGYPNDYYDVANNLPLVRRGSLASLPTIDFNNQGHLVIDAQVFPGSSGSPVYTADPEGTTQLLGVVQSAIQTVRAGNIDKIELPIGLGLIVNQQRVRELIAHATQQIARVYAVAAAAHRQAANSPVPTRQPDPSQ